MKHLYQVLENKKLGIFESPTGTGKSLSIICGALQWLRDHNERERNEITIQIQTIQEEKSKLQTDKNDWISLQAAEIELNHKLTKLKLQQNSISEYDGRIEKLCSKKKVIDSPRIGITSQKLSEDVDGDKNVEICDGDDDLLLEDAVVQSDEESDDEFECNKYEPVKILICSRTHSQLSQMVGEILKSPFGTNTRAVSLSSRQNYCINPLVSRLKNISLINEKCLDMQKKSNTNKVDSDGKVVKRLKSSSGQCPYNKQQNIEELRDATLTSVQDVEDLVKTGKQLNACPYYASRKAAADAHVVLVPYNTLLHKSTRESVGLKLKNNVVIVDEAHNLLDALAQMYSSEITLQQLQEAFSRLRAYKQRYSKKFTAHNLLCINQILFVISGIIHLLDKDMETNVGQLKPEIFTVENFVLTAEIDNYNMFKLLKFCRTSKIANKLHSFSSMNPLDIVAPLKKEEKSARTKVKEFLDSIEKGNSDSGVSMQMASETPSKVAIAIGNPFLAFLSFLESLTCTYKDGRIIVHRNEVKKQSRVQFLLLNPAEQFNEIVRDARAVVVAGGTMKPVSEFKTRLFLGAGASSDRIVEFSCDHIIPPENILPLVVTRGLQGEKLLFNFENRFSMGKYLKEILLEVSSVVKGGIVVFFPSYKYESWVCQQLQEIRFEKPLFREPQSTGSVDSVLNAYTTAIRKPNSRGAILFSVVGGKLSEGLNFSDDLGRCVIVVGLPYANIYSPELKEKMTYLDKTEVPLHFLFTVSNSVFFPSERIYLSKPTKHCTELIGCSSWKILL
ncbi:hypothetical protein RI129_007433 [Pyrocoelia pectoralis]|uniref:Helicase ATP-binding domain-containing protein n=1 Tax=Pyrocoelia pectoralis TaxID=417401 RepID=A0AAN7VB47_9COLE